MLNRQINYDLPAAGALSVGSGLSVVVSQPVLAEGAGPPLKARHSPRVWSCSPVPNNHFISAATLMLQLNLLH